MSKPNVWKLQDAKAQFSEVVRRARAGEPQQVTVHGKEAVVVVDPERFDVQPKPAPVRTMAELFERSKKYRALLGDEEIEFDRPLYMDFPDPVVLGGEGDDK